MTKDNIRSPKRLVVELTKEQQEALDKIEWGLKAGFFQKILSQIIPFINTFGNVFIVEVIEGRYELKFSQDGNILVLPREEKENGRPE